METAFYIASALLAFRIVLIALFRGTAIITIQIVKTWKKLQAKKP